MAPEQSKHTTVNDRTDIYNFGATMYRLATLKLPPSTIPDGSGVGMTSKLFRNILKPVTELAPGTPKQLADLIHRCVEYDAKNRPERVSDLLDELNALCEEYVRSDDDKLESIGW